MDVPRLLARRVHDHYFRQPEELKLRTVWSLSNGFRSAFKELEQFPQFRATANLAASSRTARQRFLSGLTDAGPLTVERNSQSSAHVKTLFR